MSLKRILKLLAAFATGQGVSLLMQLLVPPLFIHRYTHGVEVYGEWVALSATVVYLNTLNYGIQNYANNQMTLHYNRGEVKEAKTVQSAAMKLILGLISGAVLLGSCILFMPVARWMGLRYIGSAAASLTLFVFLLQLIANWFFAFLANSYQVIGEMHRGANWQNAMRLGTTLALAAFVWERSSFPVLALAQLAAVVVFILVVLIEIRIRAPILLPSLHHGNYRDMIAVLKPSAYYGVFAGSTFLAWQGPVLLIEKLLGPAAVAIFALSRTVFSMSRQILIVLTYSIGQESINLIAGHSWRQLRRVYDLSERVVMLFVPSVTIGTFLISPFLFRLWLHKRDLYDPGICMLMAAVSAIMALKEHKYAFQYLSNQHIGVAKFSVAAYASMIVVAAVTLEPLGITAFMVTWLAVELLNTAYIVIQNRKLFPVEFRPSLAPLPRLAGILALGLALAVWPAWHDAAWSNAKVLAVGSAVGLVLAVASYFAFGISEVQAVFVSRFRRRFASAGQ